MHSIPDATCTGGSTLCAIVQPLEMKDQTSYLCLPTSLLSIFGFNETVKETQTCQKVDTSKQIEGVDSILCVCSRDNCNSDDSYLTAFNSGTFWLTFMDDLA